MLDVLIDPYVQLDPHDRVVFANAAALELFDASLDALFGQPIQEVVGLHQPFRVAGTRVQEVRLVSNSSHS